MSGERKTLARQADDYAQCEPLFEELSTLPADSPRRQEVRARLVTELLPLAEHIATRFSGRGEPREDLVQVARIGLINAVDRFDPARGHDFLSFAVPTVMGEVRRHFRDTGWSVRVPRRLKELHVSLSQGTAALSQTLGRAPTPTELAEYLGLDINEVREGLLAGQAYQTLSVDKPVHDDATEALSLADTIGEEDHEMALVENHEALQPLLRELPKRERAILVMRFFGGYTQTQIAEKVGISQMHVSRLLSQTLDQLRGKLSE
ncbi:SigB/SigF/SigG family RNA polymerase sigma factor [Amycolatopsis regifaucium]|uniref:RNA polymerase subunit sigma n=1 Tax=Amycolatopsis regifaucium TaxID=546365 RepID=A0A154M492_9PSEU|nr:SigB/SigF/SigG family RNA polymerase sigma factor [Amycolatopsis regifaucium]KZB79376.1 RNA polymerase subunit sigma [Amycolatopsis regifaucium]OKA07559.1 RNA polymerase subunit sigma [Amycolatopsis regifaucium]SFH08339.1 RNA polymerase sigma-B factor [Amycolatopsis regifaucium]